MTRSLLALVLFALATPALADAPEEGAPARTPIQDYRHELMEAVGAHAGLAGAIVDGEVERPPRDVLAHAIALYELAQVFDDLFPEGSGPDAGKTRAMPAIWSDADAWAQANQEFQGATEAFMEAAKGGDKAEIEAAWGDVGKSCYSCHKGYRAPRPPAETGGKKKKK